MEERGEDEGGDTAASNHDDHRRHRRTADVSQSSVSSFDDLALPSWLVSGLEDCGFIEPSPVQVRGRVEKMERERREEKERCDFCTFIV